MANSELRNGTSTVRRARWVRSAFAGEYSVSFTAPSTMQNKPAIATHTASWPTREANDFIGRRFAPGHSFGMVTRKDSSEVRNRYRFREKTI
jgi:hypothetical protein